MYQYGNISLILPEIVAITQRGNAMTIITTSGDTIDIPHTEFEDVSFNDGLRAFCGAFARRHEDAFVHPNGRIAFRLEHVLAAWSVSLPRCCLKVTFKQGSYLVMPVPVGEAGLELEADLRWRLRLLDSTQNLIVTFKWASGETREYLVRGSFDDCGDHIQPFSGYPLDLLRQYGKDWDVPGIPQSCWIRRSHMAPT